MLDTWLNSAHLGDGLRRAVEAAVARPHFRYAVLDGFFSDDALATLKRELDGLEYKPDNPEQGFYDSSSCLVPEESETRRFLTSEAWRAYVGEIAGMDLGASKTFLAARRHRPEAHGFWPHSDSNKKTAVFLYLNDDWTLADGAALQVWLPMPARPWNRFSTPFRRDVLGRDPMHFLNEHTRLTTESTTQAGRTEMLNLLLLDQVLPLPNRVVVASLTGNLPFIHSITPSAGKERRGILQWFL